jgi:beta-glucanase (GH16 family)
MLAVCGVSQISAAPAGYKMVWEDNFDGDRLDTNKWTAEVYKRRHAQNWADSVIVTNGILTLLTYTKDYTNYTGFLSSKGKFETTFGYFEARIRFHTTPGEWGAFWIHSDTVGNPIGNPAKAGTEIDICEHRSVDDRGRDISDLYAMTLHWDGYDEDHKYERGLSRVPPGAEPLQDGWHTYGMLWTADGYIFYLDGVEQWRYGSAVSLRPQFIHLTCEVEKEGWAGRIPISCYGSRDQSKTKMEVDWVRVWQKK